MAELHKTRVKCLGGGHTVGVSKSDHVAEVSRAEVGGTGVPHSFSFCGVLFSAVFVDLMFGSANVTQQAKVSVKEAVCLPRYPDSTLLFTH